MTKNSTIINSHDITEILLKMALKPSNKQTNQQSSNRALWCLKTTFLCIIKYKAKEEPIIKILSYKYV